MPLLASKRRKTDATTQPSGSSKVNDVLEKTLSTDSSKPLSGQRSATLRAKASSPQLLCRGPEYGSQRRPGLNRNASRSWYGSWNNKASAVAQVVTENVSVAGGLTKESLAASNAAQKETAQQKPLQTPGKNAQLNSAPTRTDSIAAGISQSRGSVGTSVDTEKVDSPDPGDIRPSSQNEAAKDAKDDPVIRSPQTKTNPTTQTWLGWWSRPDGYAASVTGRPKEDPTTDIEATKTPVDETVESETTDLSASHQEQAVPTNAATANSDSTKPKAVESVSRAWFGLWSASQNQSQTQESNASTQDQSTENVILDGALVKVSTGSVKDVAAAGNRSCEHTRISTESDSRPVSSGWAFWSKDQQESQDDKIEGRQKHLGEIAVANTPSQSHPEAAQFNEMREEDSRQKVVIKKADDIKSSAESSKSTKPGKMDTAIGKPQGTKQVQKTIETDKAFATSNKAASSTSLSLPEASKSDQTKKADAALTPAAKALKAQQQRPNMVEPQFHSTFPKAHVPTYWESLGYDLGFPFGLAPPRSHGLQHVSISAQKPRIKNAIAIGVHGYFPTPLVSRIIGQPTGTSIRFATHAAAAIRTWVQANQPDIPCEIEQVALEGEGFIADRVAILWKLLLNWLNELRNADFILVAAHSQGVPVAVMLVAKLIQLGCLNSQVRIGICAMAGVNLGPFAEYKSRFFGGSALELFDFSKADSRVSREYASAIDVVLRHGVRTTYVGSLDDQLVSLESSLFVNLTHPYVQRAVFVDGRLHAPDFVTHLMAFVLKLRNLGISDHGLIRELSAPLAGSIYGGEGHSRVYDEDAVYMLALHFALESTDVSSRLPPRPSTAPPREKPTAGETRRGGGGIPSSTLLANSIRRGSISASLPPGIAPLFAPFEAPVSGVNANPYFLPWAMRGILEEPAVKDDMQDEVKDLLHLFDEWKPTSKALRDVRFRLEAVKSRL